MNSADNLQKQKKKVENDIEDNLQAQKNQQSTIEKQKQVTENLRAKRR